MDPKNDKNPLEIYKIFPLFLTLKKYKKDPISSLRGNLVLWGFLFIAIVFLILSCFLFKITHVPDRVQCERQY
jgi:hypothetical protein